MNSKYIGMVMECESLLVYAIRWDLFWHISDDPGKAPKNKGV